jgi:hypothetical protein
MSSMNFTLHGIYRVANLKQISCWSTDRMLETKYDDSLSILAIERNQFIALKLVAFV